MGEYGDDWQPNASQGVSWGHMDLNPAPRSVSDMAPSFGEYLGAQGGQVWHENGLASSIYRIGALDQAKHPEFYSDYGAKDEYGNDIRSATEDHLPGTTVPVPRIPASAAKEQAKAAGVPEVDFGHGDTTQAAVDIMIDRAQHRAMRAETIAAYKPSIVGNVTTQLVMGMSDPLNLGMAMIPYAGQARLGVALGQAASFGERTAVRTAQGFMGGATFTAATMPITAAARLSEGQDFTVADAVRDTLFGGALGSGIHVLGGSSWDVWTALRGNRAPLSNDPVALKRGMRPELPEMEDREPNPVVQMPMRQPRSSIENMNLRDFALAWSRGRIPFDTSGPETYTRLNAFGKELADQAIERDYIPFNYRQMPQGIRQEALYQGEAPDGIIGHIDFGQASGIHDEDIIAHIVHNQALDSEPGYRKAWVAWSRERELRYSFGRMEGATPDDIRAVAHEDIAANVNTDIAHEILGIDWEHPQRPFAKVPSAETVAETHAKMQLHSDAHDTLMAARQRMAERSMRNDPPLSPAEVHDRLPEAVKEKLTAGALADVMEGKPVKSAQILKIIAQLDPEIRDSVDMLRALQQDGPPIADVEARTEYWKQRLAETAPDLRATKGITGVLKRLGGLRDTEGRVRLALGKDIKPPAGAFITQKGIGRTKRGLELSDAVEKLKDEGYDVTEDSLLENLKKEWEGDTWTLPADLAARQIEWEGRDAHNRAMAKAAGVARNSKRDFQADQIAGYERSLAENERALLNSSASELLDRFHANEPTPDVRPEPVKVRISDHETMSREEIAKEVSEIEKLTNEAKEKMNALSEEARAEVEAMGRELDRLAKDMQEVAEAAAGCMMQPEEPKYSANEITEALKQPKKEKPAKVKKPKGGGEGEGGNEPSITSLDLEMAIRQLGKKPEPSEPWQPPTERGDFGPNESRAPRFSVDPNIAAAIAKSRPKDKPEPLEMRGSADEVMNIIRRRDKLSTEMENNLALEPEDRRKGLAEIDNNFHDEMLRYTLGGPMRQSGRIPETRNQKDALHNYSELIPGYDSMSEAKQATMRKSYHQDAKRLEEQRKG